MLLQALTKIFEDEVEKKVNEKLNKYIEHVSKTYDISMKLLLRDLQNIDDLTTINSKGSKPGGKPGQCLGINSNSKRCKFQGKIDGYCSRHVDQKPRHSVPVKTTEPVIEHNHTIPPMFSKDCPACNHKNKSRDNLLIDI